MSAPPPALSSQERWVPADDGHGGLLAEPVALDDEADVESPEPDVVRGTVRTPRLWERLLVVGVGEVEDGAFPSLSVGATSLVFEPLWEAAKARDRARDAELTSALAKAPRFAKHFAKILARLSAASADDAR